MKRWLQPRRLAMVGAAYLFLCAIGSVVLVEISLHPPTLRPVNNAAEGRATEMAARFGSTLEPASIEAADGTPLEAWLLQPAPARRNGKAVLLLHGVSDSRIGVLGFAPFLLEQGYTLLLPDARAHGQSGGLATYGLQERSDIRAWAAWLRARVQPPGGAGQHCIYGFGASMGAAMLLQSLDGGALDFCAVTADSPFADFKEVAFDRVAQPFSAGPWLGRTLLRPLVEIAFVYARWKYNFDFHLASPRRTLQGSTVPVLLIHGEADHNIPIRHAFALKAAHPAAEFWPVPGATHTAAHGSHPAEYERRALAWFAQHPSLSASTVKP